MYPLSPIFNSPFLILTDIMAILFTIISQLSNRRSSQVFCLFQFIKDFIKNRILGMGGGGGVNYEVAFLKRIFQT